MTKSIFTLSDDTVVPVLAGCERTKSANPLSPSLAGPIAGVTITPPTMLEPTNVRSILGQGPARRPGRRQLVDHLSAAVHAAIRGRHRCRLLVHGGQARRRGSGRLVNPAGAGRSSAGRPHVLLEGPGRRRRQQERLVVDLRLHAAGPDRVGHAGTAVPGRQRDGVDAMTPEFRVANGVSSGPHSELYYQFQISTDSNFAQHHDQRRGPSRAVAVRRDTRCRQSRRTTPRSIGARESSTRPRWGRGRGSKRSVRARSAASASAATRVPDRSSRPATGRRARR